MIRLPYDRAGHEILAAHRSSTVSHLPTHWVFDQRQIDNARAFLALQERQGLSTFLWDFVDGKPVINRYKLHTDVPPTTDLSTAISKALKKEGFRFVGPTTVYAFLQSMGFVNDHLVGCHRHRACADLQKVWRLK